MFGPARPPIAAVLACPLIGCAMAPSQDTRLSQLGSDQAARADAKVEHPDTDEMDDDESADDEDDMDRAPSIDAGAATRRSDGGSSASAPRVPDASTHVAARAGSNDAGVRSADASASDRGSAAFPDGGAMATAASVASTCDPLTCTNNCALYVRCCNALNACACEDPLTRLCTLASLPGPSLLPPLPNPLGLNP